MNNPTADMEERVYRLSDEELVRAMREFAASPIADRILRSEWERRFARGVEEAYVSSAGLSWRQRRVAREILLRFIGEQRRRALVRGGLVP